LQKDLEFIQKLLFNNFKKIRGLNSKINSENIIKIASSHLVIPLLYHKIKKNKISHLFDKDLIKYLLFLKNINENRNNELIKECTLISKKLNENKIEHIFIKGAANIFGGIYECNSVRMIGDIDILVDKKKISDCLKMFDKMGYRNKINLKYAEHRHLERIQKKNKLFAIEIHTRLYDFKNIIKPKDILKNKRVLNGISIPSIEHMFYNNIYNFQINDGNIYLMRLNLKNIYDSLMIYKKMNSGHNIDRNVYTKFYFTLINFKIKSLKYKFDFKPSKRIITFLKICNYNFFTKKIFIYLSKSIYNMTKIRKRPAQILETILNKNYRKKVFQYYFEKN